MPIPPVHAHRFIYHFTHIDNLPGLLQTGFLANNHCDFPKSGCRSIAERGIQARRAEMCVTCDPQGVVHDYVPLYFGSLSPMLLAVIRKKNVDQMDMLYFEFPISLVNWEHVVFTDASANTVVPPSFYSDPTELQKLNWNAIDCLKWGSGDETFKHQRMAEVLVQSHLPVQEAIRVVVWNESAKSRVEKIVAKANVPFPPIEFESRYRYHWYKNFMEGSARSIVMGPREIAGNYRSACEEIAQKAGQNADAQFGTPKKLLEALREDFGCLPHTAELIGLESENVVHQETVDIHTLQVVENLKALPEFATLPPEYRDRVELAAYLHDIGKGPKARWKDNGGVQKVDPDHPVRAMPMMVEILTEYVEKVASKNAQLIVQLVCYHDLVGEVLGKDRDEQQIVDVAKTKLELDALFALGKADATALVDWWWCEGPARALYDRCWTAIKARYAL